MNIEEQYLRSTITCIKDWDKIQEKNRNILWIFSVWMG